MALDTKNNIASSPLLEPLPLSNSKRASKLQTLGNIIVTVVGTGVLGLPFAFRIAGWVAGSLGVAIVGMSTYYCMLLLVGHLFSQSLHQSFLVEYPNNLFFFPYFFKNFIIPHYTSFWLLYFFYWLRLDTKNLLKYTILSSKFIFTSSDI